MIPEEKLTEIRNQIPIVELISEFVQLKKTGKNHRGLCPFHQEKTPSFFVNEERESFHCFGCGTGGNQFHFLMKIEGISFPEAVERLGDRVGISVETYGKSNPESQRLKKSGFEINRQAAWYYHCLLKKLPKSEEVWAYLDQRKITADSIENFFLGYCPPQSSGLHQHLKQKGFSPEEIHRSSLFKGDREFFRGRLLFPIFRQDRKVCGFGGRRIREQDFGPKYLNSPESDLFKKGELFYGIHLAKTPIRQNNRAIITEGYLDVLTLHSHGFTESIAPLGTALTPSHAKHLGRIAEEIILLFDGDSAGDQAALRALQALLETGRTPLKVSLEPGEDPDSYLKRYGKLAFEKKLESRRNLLEELIDNGSASIQSGVSMLDQKGQVARRILAYIEKIPDTIVKNLYRRRLSEALEIPEDWVHQRPAPTTRREPLPARSPRQRRWLPEEEIILEIWLKHSNLRPLILDQIPIIEFCTKEVAEIADSFWDLARREPSVKTGKYFDLAPPALIEVLSELAMRDDGLEEEKIAKSNLDQAMIRLKEKRLRLDLQTLKNSSVPESIHLIQKKIEDLSQVLKNKERIYGEG